MFSLKSIVLIAAVFIINSECSAPLVAPAHVGYAHAVPQNVPPYASQVSVVSKAISPYIAAPVAAPFSAPLATPVAAPLAAPIATPLAAPVAAPFAAPYAAQFAAPYAAQFAAPYAAQFSAPIGPIAARVAAPYAAAPYVAAPYAAAPYALPGPYAPLVRGPFGVPPAFVR